MKNYAHKTLIPALEYSYEWWLGMDAQRWILHLPSPFSIVYGWWHSVLALCSCTKLSLVLSNRWKSQWQHYDILFLSDLRSFRDMSTWYNYLYKLVFNACLINDEFWRNPSPNILACISRVWLHQRWPLVFTKHP